MPTLRNNSLVPVIANNVSAKDLGHAHDMPFPMSLRDLLEKRDKSRVTRIGFNVCTPVGEARNTPMPDYWFDRVFVDVDGVATFFREMSGGRRYVEWQVFSTPLLTRGQKAAADLTQSNSVVIQAYRDAASKARFPLDQFNHFIWMVDDGQSTAGVSIGDTLIGAIDFDPQNAEHETTHTFGVAHHADLTKPDDYNSPFCVMGKGPVARSFQNDRLNVPNVQYTNGTDGPGICAPYLYVAGWLDYDANVVGIPPDALEEKTGGAPITIFANQGAPPPGSDRRIAIAIGQVPFGFEDPAQYWIEYRHTSRFDRKINERVDNHFADLPAEGVVILHEVTCIASSSGTGLHSYTRAWVGATPGMLLAIPAFGVRVRIVNVNAAQRFVVLAIDPIN